jgi:hypothetical protein
VTTALAARTMQNLSSRFVMCLVKDWKERLKDAVLGTGVETVVARDGNTIRLFRPVPQRFKFGPFGQREN